MEFFEEAIGKATSDPAVIAVIKELGTVYVVGDYTDRNSLDYDPDVARPLRWEFHRVPKANFYPTHLRVLDGVSTADSVSPRSGQSPETMVER